MRVRPLSCCNAQPRRDRVRDRARIMRDHNKRTDKSPAAADYDEGCQSSSPARADAMLLPSEPTGTTVTKCPAGYVSETQVNRHVFWMERDATDQRLSQVHSMATKGWKGGCIRFIPKVRPCPWRDAIIAAQELPTLQPRGLATSKAWPARKTRCPFRRSLRCTR